MSITLPSTPSFRLDGRRALVAGAGRGIGSAAAAAALAEAGAAVTLAARSRNELDAVALAIRARGGRADVLPGFLEVVTSKIALGRIGKLEDIMGAVVFLASDASALVTGSALMADGGWTAA